jgi:hypothetical protein
VRLVATWAAVRKATVSSRKRGHEVQTFYFDMKDGVPVRDRIGKQFRLNSEAINYSKALAESFRNDPHAEPDLMVVVVDESGREVHREPVYPTVLP